MRTTVLITGIFAIGMLMTSCEKDMMRITPSQNVTTSDLQISDINEIQISSLFHVYVSFSETEESAYIEANENLHSVIRGFQEADRLIVEIKDHTTIKGQPVLNLYVKTSSLDKVLAEGAVTVEFENTMVNDQLELDLTGASHFKGSIETGLLIAHIEGASNLEMSGFSNRLSINATGASDMEGFEFTANHLKANLDGACNISLTVQEELEIDARGASKVYYKGNGVISYQHLEDASEIIKVN